MNKIHAKLKDWLDNPAQFEEYGEASPPRDRIALVQQYIDNASISPTSIYTGPHGSIIVEYIQGEFSFSLYFWDDDCIDLIKFKNMKVVDRLIIKE